MKHPLIEKIEEINQLEKDITRCDLEILIFKFANENNINRIDLVEMLVSISEKIMNDLK